MTGRKVEVQHAKSTISHVFIHPRNSSGNEKQIEVKILNYNGT